MEVTIPERIGELIRNPKAPSVFPEGAIKRLPRVIAIIKNAVDERDFRAFGKGLGFEPLKGDRSHQHAFRLNDQFRLIVEIRGEAPRKAVEVIEIVDYH